MTIQETRAAFKRVERLRELLILARPTDLFEISVTMEQQPDFNNALTQLHDMLSEWRRESNAGS